MGGNSLEPMTAEQEAAFQDKNATCLACHEGINPRAIEDFKLSTMAKAGVGCEDCHDEVPGATPGEGHRLYPNAETCAKCHPNQYKGHRANRHSVAFVREMECGRFDDFPTEFQVGSGYHFTQADVDELSDLMNIGMQGTPANASPLSVQTCGRCHNIENTCGSCHTRHRFTTIEARDPNACATCHMGPDHPQIEAYETSKHGARHAVFGEDSGAPTCVTCHMPYNSRMLGKKTAPDGTKYTDHNLAMVIAYGPVGGGAKRKGFVTDETSGRVKFKKRDADATYDELWMDRTDGKFYDAPTGGTAVFDDLFAATTEDVDGDGLQDYTLVQVEDSLETLTAARAEMKAVCSQCHAPNWVNEELLLADLIHERSKQTLAEAKDIVLAMSAAGILNIDPDNKPDNPETGTNGTYGANMKIRNLTTLEKMYFTAMKYDTVKTWKGAFHQNPDYTHWLGWTALQMNLGQMGDEATKDVLLNLWVQGKDYPGTSGDPYTDGLYQGVVYDTATMDNVYDKFPGPDDVDLPNYGQDIDVDMDGTPEFLAVDGQPGTYTINGDTSGKTLTFH